MSESPAGPLVLDQVVAGYGGAPVVRGVSLVVPRGQVTTIIGPNGCGKSTLLRVLARLLRPASGRVLLDGEPIERLRTRRLATRLAMLPQNPVAPEGMTVADLVARGRQPHQPWYRQWSHEDEQIIEDAMVSTGVLPLAGRPIDELSGGQRQRAWIAMTLAQQTDIVLLDEPTTHLDLAHAVEVLDLVMRLRRETGRTIVTVLHDMNLAARYTDRLVVLKDGAVLAEGTAAEVLAPTLLADAFGLEAYVFEDPAQGLPTVVPVRHG
jgi:iron complex transport system ATP-binding protein